MKKRLLFVMILLAVSNSIWAKRYINILTFKESVESFVNDISAKLPKDVVVNVMIVPSYYEEEYDSTLKENFSGKKIAEKDKIDIFFAPSEDSFKKYILNGYCADLITDIGFSEQDFENQFEYTKAVSKDDNGIIRGSVFDTYVGGFAYRRSIAKEVFGTDNPEVIQKLIGDWKKFEKAALQLSKNGYKIVPSGDDLFLPYISAQKIPIVNPKDGQSIQLDPVFKQWADYSKKLYDQNCIGQDIQWTQYWMESMNAESNVFGYFAAKWMIDYIIGINPEVAMGDWALCLGPASYYDSSTVVCAAKDTKDAEIVKQIIYELTCSTESMMEYTKKNGDTINNKVVYQMAAEDSSFNSQLLDGQNSFEVYLQAGLNVKAVPKSIKKNEYLFAYRNFMFYYYLGTNSYEGALDSFYDKVIEIQEEIN